ncbi:hypothetical protein KC19_VG059500 [Ceratodon purpureus]|uniref:Uncharacterized protein n=1 Tax=Ceratodon purpureus TaxID=3225 RepID=A0A8T0HMX5_CERPU|nr:hypothetical protein KC19_VG059500 [Ceratodon purpureus]
MQTYLSFLVSTSSVRANSLPPFIGQHARLRYGFINARSSASRSRTSRWEAGNFRVEDPHRLVTSHRMISSSPGLDSTYRRLNHRKDKASGVVLWSSDWLMSETPQLQSD